MRAKMKIAEARNVTSAEVRGCKKGGKWSQFATNWNRARIGPASVPTGECTKCSISIAEVTAKKVPAPRQNGSQISSAGMSTSITRQQKLQKACDTRRTERTTNQIYKGTSNRVMRLVLIASPNIINVAPSDQRAFCNESHVAQRSSNISTPSP